MVTYIDIFTGFLGSGKTSLINEVLKNSMEFNERVAVIQRETGEKEVDKEFINNENVLLKKFKKDESIRIKDIMVILNEFLPNRMIIEENGISDLRDLLNVLDKFQVRKHCVINSIVNVIDCRNFDSLMSIVGQNMITNILYSDLIVLNYSDKILLHEFKDLKKEIRAINKYGRILNISTPKDFTEYEGIKNSRFKQKNKKKNPGDKLSIILLIFAVIYLSFTIMRFIKSEGVVFDISKLQIISTIFTSILIEAFPFLLIGVFISSIIQVVITREMIIKYFPKSRILSFIVASLGGLLFPVCDCAIVPVATRLIKKGVPMYAAVTFLLAAPIVNPIVIASTGYAFQGQKLIVALRIGIGIIVAILTGIIFMIFPEDEKTIFTGFDNYTCNCIYCSGYDVSKIGIWDKIVIVFRHAGEEFLNSGRFLVIGALIASISQTFIPQDIFFKSTNKEILFILIMMAAGFVLSLCSSSDAFIARSFARQIPIVSVLGFLVLGPMADIKNMLMLSGSFKKRFIIKLFFIVFNLIFSILCFTKVVFF